MAMPLVPALATMRIFLSVIFAVDAAWASGGLCIAVAEQAGFGFDGEFAVSSLQVAERFRIDHGPAAQPSAPP